MTTREMHLTTASSVVDLPILREMEVALPEQGIVADITPELLTVDVNDTNLKVDYDFTTGPQDWVNSFGRQLKEALFPADLFHFFVRKSLVDDPITNEEFRVSFAKKLLDISTTSDRISKQLAKPFSEDIHPSERFVKQTTFNRRFIETPDYTEAAWNGTIWSQNYFAEDYILYGNILSERIKFSIQSYFAENYVAEDYNAIIINL